MSPDIPAVLGTGPLFSRTPPPVDNMGFRRGKYSAYWRVYTVRVPAKARAFAPAGSPTYNVLQTANVSTDLPGGGSYDMRVETTPLGDYLGRVALNGDCFTDLDQADPHGGTCIYLDSQNAIQPGLGWDNALKFAQALGYEFYISSANISFDKANAALTTTLQIKNTGIAPFYYPWLFEFALAENGSIKQKWTADWDIRKVLPGAAETRFVQSQISVPPGNYRLLVRIHNLARKDLFISFANENQGADLQGWLTLGSTTL